MVAAWSVDRLGRSLQDLVAFLGELHGKGIDLYLHQQGIDTTTPAGRILRTIDGGHSWYVTPEGNTTIPANDRVNMLAPCEADVNIVFGGGLGDGAADGFLVKGSGGGGAL